jgi:hypothetical protein
MYCWHLHLSHDSIFVVLFYITFCQFKDLDPNSEIRVQLKEKLRAYLHTLKTTLTDFVHHWNRSSQNDHTQAPKFATDDITLYAFYTLYIMNDEMCSLFYWDERYHHKHKLNWASAQMQLVTRVAKHLLVYIKV